MRLFTLTAVLIYLSFIASVNAASTGKEAAVICAGCHGAEGIGLSNEYPNLAGQKQAYLVKQLHAFRDGSRMNSTMNVMAKSLTDEQITQITAYYSSIKSAGPMPIAVPKTEIAKVVINKLAFPTPLYASMKKSASMEELPAGKFWKGGPNMLYNALTPDGKRLLSTSPSTSSVYIFDVKTGDQLAVIKLKKAPKGVKVAPNGLYAYVANEGSNEISIIDLVTLTAAEKTIKVGKTPHNLRFNASGSIAYVTLQGDIGLGVIDTATHTMVKKIPTPGITGPHNIDLSKDEKIAYIRDFVHHVAILDLTTEQVLKVITVGNGHGGIDVSPNDRYISAGAIGDNYVSVIDSKTLTLTKVIVGKGPHGVRASSDSQWIYATVTQDNTIVVINANTLTVEQTIPVEDFPFWIAVPGNL